MDQTVLVIIVLVAGLAFGVGIGWFFGSRPVSDWRQRWLVRDGEARDLDEKFKAAIRDLAGASEKASRADALTDELNLTRKSHGDGFERLRADHAAQLEATRTELNAAHEATRALYAAASADLATLREKTANFDEQKKLLVEAREELLKEFQNTGSAVLGKAQEAFLKAASERFGHAEKSSEEKIKTLLAPVGERLKKYEETVEALEKQRVDAFGQLTGQIEAMRIGQEKVRDEAARLGNSLRNAPKMRGRWGEQALRNVLEQCGLSAHTDFIMEHSIETSEGRLRPDAIVRIPGNKLLIIDAKVSLNAYQDAFEASDDTTRELHLDKHVASMRTHIQALGTKSYQSQFDEAPDYVLMFVPGEHFISAAIEHEAKRRSLLEDAQLTSQDLWNFAFERRVLLASPTNLVAIARTVAQVWRQDALAKEAQEIGRLASELHGRLKTAAEHLKRVGGGLETAVNNYNRFVGSFERNVLTSARRLEEKGIEIGKGEIETVPQIESAPRYNASDLLSAPDEGDAEQAAHDAAD